MNHAPNPGDQELDVFACPLDGVNQIEASAGTGKTWSFLDAESERGSCVAPQVLIASKTSFASVVELTVAKHDAQRTCIRFAARALELAFGSSNRLSNHLQPRSSKRMQHAACRAG